VGVHDGDTVTALLAGNQTLKIRVRLIDAPELAQPFGYRAKQAMSALVFGRNIELRVSGLDRYGRTLALIYVDGADAGLALVTSGLAWPYYRYLAEAPIALQDDYLNAAERAQNLRIGLWIDADPIPPWEWRKAEKELARMSQDAF
jgi:endonuclease YncB( thermonuclease family)